MTRDIVIAYPFQNCHDSFISRRCYETNLLKLLSEFVTIVTLPFEYIEQGREYDPDPDYVFVNIDVWGLNLFLQRECGRIKAPFLIYLHVLYGQDIYLTYLIPLLRKEDIIVVPSEYAKRMFLKISDQFTIYVVPLPLDVKHVQRKCSPVKASQGMRIAYMGQLIPEKGIGEIIRCLPRIIRACGKVTLDVIGPLSGEFANDEKSQYVKQLIATAKELRVADHIRWRGCVVSDEKYKILSQADIFVNPSTFKMETFGVVNTEALACGLPVVCSRWSGFSEVINDGSNGFLIDVKKRGLTDYAIDRRQLVSILTQLLQDTQLLNSMKHMAKKAAWRYDYQTLMPRLAGLLKKKRKNQQGRWDVVKEKKIIDYRFLYRRKWLDFIRATHNDKRTYSSIRLNPQPRAVRNQKKIRQEIFRYLSGI